MQYTIESERLWLRRLCQQDFAELCSFLQDIEVMYAWEHAFSDEEVQAFLEENLRRYQTDGYAYMAAIEKQSGAFIGVIGPLVETIEGQRHPGVGYILKKEYWGRGFAEEGARACVQYLFDVFKALYVVATIRPENVSSRSVAHRLGMYKQSEYTKMYKGKPMRHLVYRLDSRP